jgi:hypothetical protein
MFQDEDIHELQTKSLNNFLDSFWISPNGELYFIDYEDCFRMVKSTNNSYGFDWTSTGKNAKLKPYYYSGIVYAYTASIYKPNNFLFEFELGKLIRIENKIFKPNYFYKEKHNLL